MKKPQYRTKPHSVETVTQERIAPRKDLGQNFLRDANIARNIVRALDVQAGDTIIEIGPGEGALTKLLLEQSAEQGGDGVVAVEYDARAVELLRTKFADAIAEGRLHLVQSDVLKTTIRDLSENVPSQPASAPKRLKIIGNIPYYITSDILFWVFGEWAKSKSFHSSEVPTPATASNQPVLDRAVIMMQKEVGERIVAKQRTKDYGILSIASMLVSEPKVLFHVSPSCFFPPPKVTSSVVEFRLRPSAEAASAFLQTQPLVRVAFNQRRKMLSNALHGTLSQISAAQADTTPATIIALAEERGLSYFRKRAEELTPQDFITLAAFLHEI